MRRTILIIALSVLSLGAFAQTKTEVKTQVKVENTDGKIHLIIDKVVDGKTTTIDKTYNSVEEMKNDPELEGINLHLLDAKNNKEMVFFSEDGEEGDHKMNVIVELDSDSDADISKGSSHSFMFKSDDTEGEGLHEIKVWTDKDGVKHMTKNGKEVELGEGNSWTDEDGTDFTIKKSEVNIMILSGADVKELKSTDGKTFEYKFSTDDAKDGEHKVVMFESSEGDGSDHETFSIKIIEHIKLHLQEVEENEFSSIAGIDAKSLKMDELNYYPNPNEGKFTLQFKADKRPTEIKITSLEGKEIYAETLVTLREPTKTKLIYPHKKEAFIYCKSSRATKQQIKK